MELESQEQTVYYTTEWVVPYFDQLRDLCRRGRVDCSHVVEIAEELQLRLIVKLPGLVDY